MPLTARIGSWSLALLLLVAAAGCGSNSFLGQRIDNFTAYYNTFYNARQAYDQGVQAMEGSVEPIDRTTYLHVFSGAARVGGNVSFQNAIDKGADILRDHPNSKWVDDALLLIGKSYFYQSNFVGAEQKFREVIDLGSNLEDESRIWLARTLIASGAYDDARDHLVTSLETEDVSDRWAPRLRLALGELYVRQNAFEDAAQELETGLEGVRDNEIEAKSSFLLGQVYETLGRYEDAVAAYRHVQTAHPPYELSYAANLSAVRVQGLYLDEAVALEQLRRMERDGKNYNNRYELAYVRGRIYQAQGRAPDARSLFHGILRDPEAQINTLRGRLHYALAELYRDEFNDYLVASAHFDTARTSLTSQAPASRSGAADGAPQYASEAITDAEFQAEIYGSFAEVRRRIARMDSLLELGSLSQEAFEERILEIRRQRAEELAEQQRRAAQLQAERGFQDAASRTANRPPEPAGVGSQTTGEAGFLYHRDPIRVQEARMNFTARWGDRPLVPNWRRSDAVAAASRTEAAGPLIGADLEMAERATQSAQLPTVDYSDVPRDPASQALMEADRARARYELANVLFLSMNQPDSAAVWYSMVVNEDADEEVAQRAFYALAEVKRSLGDSEAATRLYEQVLRAYPDSDFAGRVREQLGVSASTPSDSLTIALADYDAAFRQWRRGWYGPALNSMVTASARHSQTEVAPKALIAAGRIYLEWANADTMDVFGPLPLTVPHTVLEKAGLLSGARPDADTTALEEEAPSLEIDPPAENGSAAPRPRIELDPTDGTEDASVDDETASALNDTSADGDLRADTTVLAQADPRPADTADAEPSLPDASGVEPEVADPSGVEPGIADTGGSGLAGDTLTAAGDTLTAAADTLTVAGAALTAAADTLTVAGAALTAAGDTLTAAGDAVYLSTLYASVREHYPSTPYARLAEDMLDLLEQRRRELEAPPVPAEAVLAATARLGAVGSLVAGALDTAAADLGAVDSTATASMDTTALDVSRTELDTLAWNAETSRDDEIAEKGDRGAEAAPDPTRPAGDTVPTTVADTATDSAESSPDAAPSSDLRSNTAAVPSGAASTRGEGGIRPELGGFTIILGLDVEREPIEALVRKHAERGLRADVLETTADDVTLYRAAVGHFPTMEAASAALDDLREELEGPGYVVSLLAP